MTRLEVLNEIINMHVECLSTKTDPLLTDTKMLTEILKSILVLEQIKKIEGNRTELDALTADELAERAAQLGESDSD